MNIGEFLQKEVDAAKALAHAVEHDLIVDAREAFHEAQVLATTLKDRIVALGANSSTSEHVAAALAAVDQAVASVVAHVGLQPAAAPAPPAVAAVSTAVPLTPAPVTVDPEPDGLEVLPIAGDGN